MSSNRWVMIGFYSFLAYTALSTTLAWATRLDLIGGESPTTSQPQTQAEAREERIPQSAETFAKNFVKEYLLWTKGGEESRAKRLEMYLDDGLDAQAGFEFTKGLQWNSYSVNRDVWEIRREKGEFRALVYAETVMSKGKEEKRVDRWVQVTFVPAGDSYVVTESPRLVAPPEPSQPKKPEKESLDSASGEVVQSIEGYLEIFFKDYTTGSPEEIGYHFVSKDKDPGVTGILALKEIQEVRVFETEEDNTFRVDCQVVFEDLASGATLEIPYTLYVVQQQNRWLISNLEQ